MIIGIDFGSSNSLAAIWRDGRPWLVPNALGAFTTPSCVSIDEDMSVLVGEAARERLQTHPDRSAALFKHHLGSEREFRLGDHTFRAEELVAFVLRSLRADAEAWLGLRINEAVLTVPAHFSDSQRRAAQVAGELAGLAIERLVTEPAAAALAHQLSPDIVNSQLLVVDMGGGTFDVAVLDLFDGVVEVKACAGDGSLGGADLVRAIVDQFFVETGLPREARGDRQLMQVLAHRAEALKTSLSDAASGWLTVMWDDREYAMNLDRERFKALAQPLLDRSRELVEQVLRDAQLRPDDIDEIVLAGGATRTPLVRQMMTRMFGRFPSLSKDPERIVALGAGVMAGLQMRDEGLAGMTMTDVCAHTLGVETAMVTPSGRQSESVLTPVIARNTVVPASRVQGYLPSHEGQQRMVLQFYQGESMSRGGNIRLGSLTIPLPRCPRSQAKVDVRYTYDANGMVEVEATVRATQQKYRLQAPERTAVLGERDIKSRRNRLAAFKVHPRDQAGNRFLVAAAERLLRQLRGQSRQRVHNLLAQFKTALAMRDGARIGRARQQLDLAMEHLDVADRVLGGGQV